MPAEIQPFSSIVIDTDELEAVEQNGDQISVPLPDGSVVIDLSPPKEENTASEFEDNLALKMDTGKLSSLAEDLLSGIDADIQSRAEWEATRTRGIELLGLKIETPRADVGSSSAPLEGMSTYRDPVLLEAVLRFQANSSSELLPATGPVKIENDGEETAQSDEYAEVLEKDFNHYLTKTATEYGPDTRRMLFWTGFGGSGFKKLYHCPIRRRPVSESVDANDLIVSDAATDLANAPRVTHRIKMPPSIMKRMQIVGAYRDIALTPPTPQPNAVDEKKASVEGVRPRQDRPEDQPYTLYECYCEVVLDDYAPTQFKGKELPLPFKVTIDKDSREVLEVRRFWDEEDTQCMRKKRIVKYPYVEGMGLYGIGLLQIMGNSANALTAATREALDAGMYANFPGGLIAKSATKQLSNENRVGPGMFNAIDTSGVTNGDIRSAIMPLPYKDVTPGLLSLIDKVQNNIQRVGGTAELPMGEGKQDAPVGTTLALIEQATKIEASVHKGLHQAQSEEFEILIDLFREDPESFWRHNPKCKGQWDTAKLLAALQACKLVPVSDPNTPSHMHRIAKALAVKQLQAANPELYDAKAVDTRVLRMIKVDDPESLFAPPQTGAPQPDPIALAKLSEAKAKELQAQTGAAKVQNEAANSQAKLADAAAQRASDEKIATVNLAKELIIHGDDHGLATRQHALAAQTASHDATMDVSGALSGQRQSDHDNALARSTHALDVHQALNPPVPTTPQ